MLKLCALVTRVGLGVAGAGTVALFLMPSAALAASSGSAPSSTPAYPPSIGCGISTVTAAPGQTATISGVQTAGSVVTITVGDTRLGSTIAGTNGGFTETVVFPAEVKGTQLIKAGGTVCGSITGNTSSPTGRPSAGSSGVLASDATRSASAASSASSSTASRASSAGALSFTGANVLIPSGIALVLIAVGVTLVGLARRRPRSF